MTVLQKKICLLGAFAVGKTSLVRRFVEDRFDDKYLSTIGVKISRKTMARTQHTLNLIMWDLAGSDDFKDTQANYLRGVTGAILVCDLTRRETLGEFERYYEQLRAVNPHVSIVCIGNKADLFSQRAIQDVELQRVSGLLGSSHIIASAKTGEGVEQAFVLLADRLEAQA